MKKKITLFTNDSSLAKEMEQYLIAAKIPYNREITANDPKITTGSPMFHIFSGEGGFKTFKYLYSPRTNIDDYTQKYKKHLSMKKNYKIDNELENGSNYLFYDPIPYDSETGLDMEKLKEAVTVYFEDSAETGISEVEKVTGDAEKGFVIIVCVDPELDGLIEELKLIEIPYE